MKPVRTSSLYRSLNLLTIPFNVLQKLNQSLKSHPVSKKTSSMQCKPYGEAAAKSNNITQKWVWPQLGKFLREGDLLIIETGTSSPGMNACPLPDVNARSLRQHRVRDRSDGRRNCGQQGERRQEIHPDYRRWISATDYPGLCGYAEIWHESNHVSTFELAHLE